MLSDILHLLKLRQASASRGIIQRGKGNEAREEE
jgi:hypothetical protein